MENTKQYRILEIFFRGLRGEDLRVQELADRYEVSTKSITRSINEIKDFLADQRDLAGNTELQYSYSDKCYRLYVDEFLTNKELFSLIEVMIGTRVFSKIELLTLINKLKRFTTPKERPKLNALIRKELYHYTEVKHDCDSVEENLWKLVNCITDQKEISIDYYRTDRSFVTHRLRPASLMFADHYFYLIAFKTDDSKQIPFYFRVDRIKYITEHRKKFRTEDIPEFDEGLLRQRSLFMWPGKLRTIRFEYYGPSVQAVLDKLPTSKIIERIEGGYLLEAEVYGNGIKMWLFSQGSWVKVISPNEFVDEMRDEIEKMREQYLNTVYR